MSPKKPIVFSFKVRPVLFSLVHWLFVFILVSPTSSAWADNGNHRSHNRHNGENDGYAHYDNNSGRYNSYRDRWEWRGPHKGCHIKGKHFHHHHGGHGNPKGTLDCSQAEVRPDALWPANHRFTNINIRGMMTSDGSQPNITIQCVYQDEPLNGIGDGNTNIDAKLTPNGRLKLRKERVGRRSGNGNGRVYHIDFEAQDVAAGESCNGSVAVEVPHYPWGKAKDDGRLFVSLDNGFNCGNANQPPMITSNPITLAMELTSYEYAVIAEDPEGDTLGYRLTEAPDGMTISADGVIEWAPAQGDVGSYSIIVEVNDGSNSVEQNFTLVVSARENTAPVITSVPVLEATAEQSYEYTLTAIDNESDNFSFSLASGPTGLTVSLDGLVQWTPNEGQVGTHDVNMNATDILGAVGDQSYTISVAPKPNNAPEITSTPITIVDENAFYQYTVLASDPEGSNLTYRLLNAPTGLTLSNNILEWTLTFDDAGEYPVEIEVKDIEGATAAQTFLLTVVDVNRPPLFVSTPTLTVAENNLYQYTPEATDADGDTVVYQLVSIIDGMELNIDGVVEWIPSFDAAGTVDVEISADDGRGAVTINAYQLVVTNINRDPQITSSPIEVAVENSLYSYQVEASDDDGQVVTFSLLQSPIGMTISEEGLIEWLPDFTTAGTLPVEVVVNDGEVEITQSFVIVVENINQSPVATDQAINLVEDTVAVIELEAIDGDADTLTFSIVTPPLQGGIALNGNQADYTPAVNFVGTDSFTFIANDGTSDSQPAVVNITITAVNDAPVISFSPILTGKENIAYTADVNASDVEGDVLIFSLLSSPVDMSIDSVTGVISWLPNFDQAGNHPVTVAVNDTSGASDTTSFTINITNTNQPPVASNFSLTTDEDQSQSVVLVGNDNDGDGLTYQIQKQPVNGVISGVAPDFQYTPNPDFYGSDSLTFIANDGTADSTEATVTIEVQSVNDAPVSNDISLVVEFNTATDITLTGADVDADSLSYRIVTQPVHGVLTGVDENYNYTPTSNYSGIDTFQYVVNDGELDSTISTATITIESSQEPIINSDPVLFGFVGTDYQYDVEATVPNGLSLQYTLINSPAGMTIDPATGVITWLPEVEGFYDISLSVTNGVSAPVVQSYQLHIVDAESNHEGDDFWFMFMLNANSAAFSTADVVVYVSSQYETDGILEVPGMSISMPFHVSPGETLELILPGNIRSGRSNRLPAIYGVIEDKGVHISSDRNIAVYALNRLQYSTDGFVVLPTKSLGTHYMALSSDNFFLFSSAGRSEMGIVASKDNTAVSVKATISITVDGNGEQLLLMPGETMDFVLNQGQSINMVSGSFAETQSNIADFTGVEVLSDKPVAVFSGHVCANVPVGYTACDHIVEQMPPVKNWGLTYVSMPLAERLGGDTYRVVASEDNTVLTINHGEQYVVLNKGAFFENRIEGPVLFEANHPILVAQFSNSASTDSAQTGVNYDPAMMLIPAKEQFVKHYTVTAPASGYSLNYVNIIAPFDALASLKIDGQIIPAANFEQIQNTEFYGYQLPVTSGVSHTFNADIAFGIAIYGFDDFDSYAYMGGMSLPSVSSAALLNLNGQQAESNVGVEACYQGVITDNNAPIRGVRIDYTVTGANAKAAHIITGQAGSSEFCYTPLNIGTDTVTAKTGALNVAINVNITLNQNGSGNTAPYFISTPVENAGVAEAYEYQALAFDLDTNDILSYNLLTFPQGMSIAPTGLISWQPATDQTGDHAIQIEVTDATGLIATQDYNLKVIQRNRPPELVSVDLPENAFIGHYYGGSITVNDPDDDALTWDAQVIPTYMNINPLANTTGLIGWTPSVESPGPVEASIFISDKKGGVLVYSWTINLLLNATPEFIQTPIDQSIRANNLYQVQVTASDGDNEPLTYTLRNNPPGLTINPQTGLLSWTPTALDVGEYAVIVEVSDQLETASHAFTLTVFSEFTSYELTVDVSPQFADPGESISIQLDTTGEQFAVSYDLTVDGQTVSVDENGLAILTAPAQPGIYNIQASSSDGTQSITTASFYTVKDPADTTPPVINIDTPNDGLFLTEASEVIVSVNDDNLASYQLLMWPANRPQDAQPLAQGRQNISATAIANIDTSMLINGQYTLQLKAIDINGNTALAQSSIIVDGNLKVGNFSFTVEDLSIPLAGIPVQVSRTYDSRRRNEQRDLGYGWTIDYQNIELDTTRTLGAGWSVNQYNSGSLGEIAEFCVEPLGTLAATVTLPDGNMETFDVQAVDACNLFTVDLDVELEFIPTGNTLSTLRLVSPRTARLVNGHLEILGSNQVYDPSLYVLTTQQGFEYHLDQSFGISQIIDPNGNTLTYSDSGIIHSSGRSIIFTRDSQGRITYVRAPQGKTIRYTYNLFGDLVSAAGGTNGSGQTQYTYNHNHGMLDIIDPLGRKQLRNIYDDSGRLIAQEDGDGNRTDFTHDLVGRTSQVSDRLGRLTQFAYDERGNVLSTVDALNNLTQYTFDIDDNQLSQTDALGNVTLATYDNRRNQLTQTDALGNTIAFTYEQHDKELTVSDALNNTFINTYDNVGNLLTVEDPQGNVAGNNINVQGLPTLVRNTAGFDTTFAYDEFGNKTTETDHLGNVSTFTYDANGNVLTENQQRTENGVLVTDTTSYAYDSQKQLQFVTAPNGERTQFVYDVAGNKTREVAPTGQQTFFDYDAYHRLVTTMYPDQSTSSNTYDAEGNLIEETDRNGNITTHTYDALNRLIQTDYADGSNTQTQYDAIGRVIAEIDENNYRTEHEYDVAGRRILTRNALNEETHFSYDANGNLISQRDANSNTTQYEYDVLDNRVKTIYPDATESTQSYDALGQLISNTDQNGYTTAYTYDAVGRLTKVTDAQLNETRYTFDEVGNKVSQTDAEDRTTNWTYDGEGNPLSRTLPLGQSESWVYSGFNGNLLSHSDFNGEIKHYNYDVNNRLSRISYVDRSTELFKYDAEGNRIEATNRAGRKESWVYGNRNRLTNNTKIFGDQLDYSYDNAGNRIQLTITPSGESSETTDYSFDALNRLDTVTDAQNNTTNYGYDAVGNRQSVTYPNGNVTNYSYDNLNRLTQLTTTNGATTLTDYQYTLDATGHRTQIVEANGRASNYMYDDLYRLTTEDITDALNGNYSASYQYDKVGNRTASTINGVQTLYTIDDNDRLTQQGGETFTYDDNGNTLTKTIDADMTVYSYTPKNELAQADITTLGNTAITMYQYDVDGIRSQKVANGETINYLTDANRPYQQVLKETNITTNNTVSYLYGDDLIKQTNAANDSYYLYDGLGSTRALTNAAGSITDTYNYESFGSVLNQTGTTENNYLFTGEQFDTALGMTYLRARYYDQNIGRFTQMDTWMGNNSDPVTLHKYLYANADPVNNIDPTGNFTLVSFAAADSIRNILNDITINAGISLFDSSLDSEDQSSSFSGWGIIASMSPGLLKPLARKLNSKFFGSGKVAFLKKKKPLPKEIEVAELLAEKQGARIFIRGGKGTQGADFFLNGARWELKTLDSPSARAVRNGIYKSIKRGQSNRIVIDGRVGLDWKTFKKGLANAQRDGAHPVQVRVILPGNNIRDWP